MDREMRTSNGLGDTEVVQHKMSAIHVYPISEQDLDNLATATSSGLYLEIALCLLSICASFVCNLFVIEETANPKAYWVYWIVIVSTGAIGLVLLLIWWNTKSRKEDIVKKIKSQPVVPTVGP